MAKYTKEQLLEKYRQLPESVQDAIFSVNTAKIIGEIGEKHKLMIDKIGDLADETGSVMLGFTHPKDFISHLCDRLEVSREIAKEIGDEINSKIFFQIRENIKKIHGIKDEEPAPIIEPPRPFTAETAVLESTISKQPEIPTAENQVPPSDIKKETTDIFEAKTKKEIFRQPLETTEKTVEPQPASSTEPPKKQEKIDPYRESIL